MDFSNKNIPSIMGIVGIILTYIINSIKDRNLNVLKNKQKYYNILLESSALKNVEFKRIFEIKTNQVLTKKLYKEIYLISNQLENKLSDHLNNLKSFCFEEIKKIIEIVKTFSDRGIGEFPLEFIESLEYINIYEFLYQNEYDDYDSTVLLETKLVGEELKKIISEKLLFLSKEIKILEQEYKHIEKKYIMEVQRLNLYGSKEIIDYMKKVDNEILIFEMETFYKLMRKDLKLRWDRGQINKEITNKNK